MALDYNVVFEYTPKIGGHAGVRFIVAYHDEADFKANNSKPDDTVQVIAQGLSTDEAHDLVSLTPEVCRFTAAIQNLCDNDQGEIFNSALADHFLFNACIGIEHGRQRIGERNLIPIPVSSIVQPTNDQTERDQLYQLLLAKFYDTTLPYGSYGFVGDLNLARIKISLKIFDLLYSRKES